MNRFIKCSIFLFLCVLISIPSSFAQIQSRPDTVIKKDSTNAVPKPPPPAIPSMGLKSFAETIKGYEIIQGLFTFYRNTDEGKVLMEINPSQFETTFLLSVSRSAAEGWMFDSGAMLGRVPCMFRKVGNLVQFLHQNVYFRADQGAAIQRAIERGVTHSIIGSTRILSQPHPERKSILIDASDIYVQDIDQVGSPPMPQFGVMPTMYMFDRGNSYFGSIKSFPENTEFETVLHFRNSRGRRGWEGPIGYIPDDASIIHRYHFSLSALPATGYKPRIADDRFGHFTTIFQDYTNLTADDPYVRYVERWDLKKIYPYQPLSPAEKPIVFWLENTIPVEYRQAVAEGVLFWNKCFERIGIQDAIVVRQQPDDADWDPADIRYNTVQWIISPGGGYAVGPSRTNPFTGQIYDADIRVSADYIRYIFKEREEFVQPVIGLSNENTENSINLLLPEINFSLDGQNNKSFSRNLWSAFSGYHCNYAIGAVRQAAFGYNLLNVRGLSPDDPEVQKYLHDLLVNLIAHEVGHTLGLRHNFKGSAALPVNVLQDTNITFSKGLTGSIMDYTPVNIAPQGQSQGQYWQTTPGTWDYWAIEYAYKSITGGQQAEKEELTRIASRAADPSLVYGTDEDAFGFSVIGIDPQANMYDLGSDPITYYKDRFSLVQELWGKLEQYFEQPGTRYPKLRQAFRQGLSEYTLAAMTVPKYIGGIYFHRDHVGDPNARLPFVPVSAEKQREALKFILTQILSPNVFNFSPEFLNKLAPDRQWDFFMTVFGSLIDFPIHRIIGVIQEYPLIRLFNPIVMQRIIDNELRSPRGETPFTLAEMFESLRNGIWEELQGQTSINSFRRNLQRAHLQHLVALVLGSSMTAPGDAKTLARRDLEFLKDKITTVLATGTFDEMSRAHLNEVKAKIESTLKAGPVSDAR